MPKRNSGEHRTKPLSRHTSAKTASILALLAASVIWGMGFIATNIAQEAAYSSPFIMVFRFTMAAAVFAFAARKQLRGLQKVEIRAGALAGIFLFLGFVLQTYGLEKTTPTRNAFFTATTILFVPFISWFIFRKAPPLRIFLAAGLCFPGVLVLSFDGNMSLALSVGDLLTLGCAFVFAIHVVVLGYFATSMAPTRLNFIQLCTAAVLSAILYLWKGPGPALEPTVWQPAILSVIFLALFSTCLAYFLQARAMLQLSPGTTSVILASDTLWASILSLSLGLEAFKWNLLIGGALILAAVFLTEWQPRRKKRGNARA